MSARDPRVATLFAVLLVAGSAGAATVVPPANLGELAVMSDAVVLARAGVSGEAPGGAVPRTATELVLLEQIAGTPMDPIFVVTEPGGASGDTFTLIPGAPRYREGGVYLLFLDHADDGRWRSQMLAFGILERVTAKGERVLQPIPEVAGIGVLGVGAWEPLSVYREKALLRHLREVATEGRPWRREAVEAPVALWPDATVKVWPSGCDYMTATSDGYGIRWFSFDTSGSYTVHPTTPPQAGHSDGGVSAVSGGAAAWTNDGASNIDLSSGSTQAENLTCGQLFADGQVVFNDPCDDMADLSGCSGTLALGGPRFWTSTQTFDGEPWHDAFTLGVVVNNFDVSVCLGEVNFAEMMTHELGHGLGFGHYGGGTDPAVMEPSCCRGGGAHLEAKDEECAAYLYPTSEPPPDPPSGLTATAVSDSQIDLSWTDGSSDEDGFRVYRDLGAGYSALKTVAANVTSTADTSLSPCTLATYYVVAYSSGGGESSQSNTDSDTTTGSAPDEPTGLSAIAVSSARVDLGWTNGVVPQDSVRIERATGAGAFGFLATSSGSTTSYADSTVAAGADYRYRVRGDNACGPSPYSDEAAVSVPSPATPDPPTDLEATAVSETRIDLTWTDGSDDEDGFKVYRAVAKSYAQIGAVGANVTELSDTGLSSCTTASYYVVAYNGDGDSAASNLAEDTTLGDPPDSPSGLGAVSAGPAQVDLSWLNGAAPQTSVRVQRAVGAGFFADLTTVAGDATSFADTTVTEGTTYRYRVRGESGCGISAWSAEASATPGVATGPAAPSNLSATAISSSRIDLAWTDSSSDETGFEILRDTGGGFQILATVAAGVTTHADTGLSSCTFASYLVAAFNGNGRSADSNTASATTTGSAPAAPERLTAIAFSTAAVTVAWQPPASAQTLVLQRAAGSSGAFATIATADGSATGYTDAAVSPGASYRYRIQATNGCGASAWSTSATAWVTPGPTEMHLRDGRFRVRVAWEKPTGETGTGQAVQLTSDTGYFWFFNQNNVEMVVKVLDGCGLNQRFWVFAGGLTNVNVTLAVTDLHTGAQRFYANPQGAAFRPIQDTAAFDTCENGLRAAAVPAGWAPDPIRPAAEREPAAAADATSSACAANDKTLCLNDSRFRVRVSWQTPDGQEGAGQAVQLTSDTGYFWFFNQSNVEMIVKALDGCGFNQRFWVFAGGLTNVAVTLAVTDMETGEQRFYSNLQGTAFEPIQDTGAFATCP